MRLLLTHCLRIAYPPIVPIMMPILTTTVPHTSYHTFALMKVRAEVATFMSKFDDAEALYREIDRKDLAVQVR